jgi:hypothetical protein
MIGGASSENDFLKKLVIRSLAGVLILTFLLVVSWHAGGKHVFEEYVSDQTRPWAVFQVPANPMPLTGLDAKLAANIVTVCNRSNGEWNSVLVQIDQGYLASLDRLQPGECKQLPVRDFTTESWKRMPPPSDLQVTRVAVLATIAQKGYAQKSLSDQSAQSSR